MVGNTRDGGLDAEPRGVMFVPFAQELALGNALVIRSDSDVAALLVSRDARVWRKAPDRATFVVRNTVLPAGPPRCPAVHIA